MPESPREDIPEFPEYLPDCLKAGRRTRLLKVTLRDGEPSDIQPGMELSGILKYDVQIGFPIEVSEHGMPDEPGNHTSTVLAMAQRNGKFLIRTDTSLYEVINTFQGLKFRTNYMGNENERPGIASIPDDAVVAQLNNVWVNRSIRDPVTGQNHRIYINGRALQGTLLETHGGQIFRTNDGHLVVIAGVNNIHVPFHTSTGTSGKIPNQWYPFFGINPCDWWVKGEKVQADGQMLYHPSITAVQQLLNTNLILPANILPSDGYLPASPGNPAFLLARYLKCGGPGDTELGRKYGDSAFVNEITGYNPRNVTAGEDGNYMQWIEWILSHIKPQGSF